MSSSILINKIKPKMEISEKYDFVLSFFKRMAGGEFIGFNNSVFLSERDSADRNSALAYFLRENDCFPLPISGNTNIQEVLDFYFQVTSKKKIGSLSLLFLSRLHSFDNTYTLILG